MEIPRIGGSHGDIAQALALAVNELRGWQSKGHFREDDDAEFLIEDGLRYDDPL